MNVQQAADKWNISDRRVRKLCAEDRIPGVLKDGKSYLLPTNAIKPKDNRKKEIDSGSRYLKWSNETIGIIDNNNRVAFTKPMFNEVVSMYTHGLKEWSSEQFIEFLSERSVSRERRDIERILFRLGIPFYDVLRIAEITRGIHPKDLFWIANFPEERFEEVITKVFDSIFYQRIDLEGNTIDSPEGYNIKRYGVYDGRYGIYKQRINPLSTDVESEVAVYLLAKRLGVPCCDVYQTDKDVVFSGFMYDFNEQYIVHFRRLFNDKRSDNEYINLITVRPQYKTDIIRMILLDFITRQDDRHLSNIAIKCSSEGESFYPLYDNGRSLFYEDTPEMVMQAIKDPIKYATTFGYVGTYWDYIKEIASECRDFSSLIDLNISTAEISDILKSAGFKGYRFDGALEWIAKSLDMIKTLE